MAKKKYEEEKDKRKVKSEDDHEDVEDTEGNGHDGEEDGEERTDEKRKGKKSVKEVDHEDNSDEDRSDDSEDDSEDDDETVEEKGKKDKKYESFNTFFELVENERQKLDALKEQLDVEIENFDGAGYYVIDELKDSIHSGPFPKPDEAINEAHKKTDEFRFKVVQLDADANVVKTF